MSDIMFEVGKLYRITGDRLIWYNKQPMSYVNNLNIGDVVMYLQKNAVNFRGFDMTFCLFLYEAQFVYAAYDMTHQLSSRQCNSWFNYNFEKI